jgi:hypothetical protein
MKTSTHSLHRMKRMKTNNPNFKPSVYVETSVVSYLSARTSQDPIIYAHQQITKDWWRAADEKYDLCTSALVYDEAKHGAPTLAAKRVALLDGLRSLEPSPMVNEVAHALIRAAALPIKALRDAEHIALAAIHNVPYLVTWNFRHIANPMTSAKIDSVLRLLGYTPSVLCSPELLLSIE